MGERIDHRIIRFAMALAAALAASVLGACDGREERAQDHAAESSEGREGHAGLPSSAAPDTRPTVRGPRIALSRAEGTRQDRFADIYVMRPDGSRQTQLTDSRNAGDSQPAFSPDGQRIAFSRFEDKGPNEIWVMNADGSDPAYLIWGAWPAWSPDGERIAFSTGGGEGLGEAGLYLMDADGSNPTRLHDAGLPTWSPDGEQIALSRGDSIHLVNADGSAQRKLTDRAELGDVYPSSPAFSPDGERIAFLGTRQGAMRRLIWMMSADGRDPAPLANRPSTGLSFSSPSFSPNGRRIAFVGDDEGPGIYVMNADGTNQAKLPGTVVNDTDPAWGPLPGAAGKDRKLAP